MKSIRKEAARKDALLGVDDKIEQERLRFAERLVQEHREAGTNQAKTASRGRQSP